jgi:hypothetical protein
MGLLCYPGITHARIRRCGGKITDTGKQKLFYKKTVPVPLCPPQIPGGWYMGL